MDELTLTRAALRTALLEMESRRLQVDALQRALGAAYVEVEVLKQELCGVLTTDRRMPQLAA